MENSVYAIANNNNNYNVIGLNKNTIQNIIDTYFQRLKENSKSTARNYKSHIQEFVTYFFNKDVEDLAWEDFKNINKLNHNNFTQYQLYLSEKNSARTVNAKFSAIKDFLSNLLITDKEFEYTNGILNRIIDSFSNVERLSDKAEKKLNTYGQLSEEEVNQLFDYCKKQENGLIKYLFFKTLFITGIRKSAIRNLQWKNIKHSFAPESDKLIWTIMAIDKGNKINPTAISDEFYNELCQLKDENTIFTDKIFKICEHYIDDTFNDFCKEYNIDKEGRNIVIHSIKKASGNKAWVLSNHNILKVKQQLGHEDIKTSLDIYVNSDVPLSEQTSYIMDKKIDTTDIEMADKEQLIKAILSCNSEVIIKIKDKLKNKE